MSVLGRLSGKVAGARGPRRSRAIYARLCRACAASIFIASLPQGHARANEIEPSADHRAIERCLCAVDRSELGALRERVASAASVEEARELAEGPTRLARQALGRARHFVFLGGGSLESAYRRLQDYESRVEAASTPAAVAEQLDALLGASAPGSLHPQIDVDVDTPKGGCSYSTGEVIAIVLGLILGIIPGLILLILLC